MADKSDAIGGMMKENLGTLTRDAFGKMAVFAEKQVDASIDECALLEKMNLLATAKYGELEDNVKSIDGFFDDMQGKCECGAGEGDGGASTCKLAAAEGGLVGSEVTKTGVR